MIIPLLKLVKRMTVHEKNYSCNICSIHFKWANDLKTHMKTKHDFQYACDICDSTFLLKSDMNYHIKFNHRLFKGQPMKQKCCIETNRNKAKLIKKKAKEKNWKRRKKRSLYEYDKLHMFYICSIIHLTFHSSYLPLYCIL